MKTQLPDVTLYALDTANIDLTLQAIDRCTEGCDFGDILFIGSKPVTAPYRTVQVEPFADADESGRFMPRYLASHIKTPFLLSVQYDGFIVNPTAWRPEFLDYDYIGAKWAWYTDGMSVGNSGFFLMSRKLLEILSSPAINPDFKSSDEYICRQLRPRLEKEFGIRFAPESVADLFSYECSLPRQPTFGFHGLFNLWRHLDDEEMERVAREIADYTLLGPGYAKIIVQYYLMRKFGQLRAFYARLRGKISEADALRHFAKMFNPPFARELVSICENLLKTGPNQPAPPIALAPGADIKEDNQAIDARGRLFPWER